MRKGNYKRKMIRNQSHGGSSQRHQTWSSKQAPQWQANSVMENHRNYQQPRPQIQPYVEPLMAMKNSYQGSSQYTAQQNQPSHLQRQQQTPVWTQQDDSRPQQLRQQTEKMSYGNRNRLQCNETMNPIEHTRDMSKVFGRLSPTRAYGIPAANRQVFIPEPTSMSGRMPSPGRRMSPGRGMSPGRRMSPGIRMSSGRGMSPGIRMSSGRGMSPGRRMSPGRGISPGRRMSPGRRLSPTGRRISPDRPIVPRNTIPPERRRDLMHGDRRQDLMIDRSDRRTSPDRHISPPGRSFSPSGRNALLSGPHVALSNRTISPSGRRISPPGRRMSPTGRYIAPSGSGISPSERRVSPGRRISPSERRMSPSGRRISPFGRRISPPGVRISPGRRISPSGRRISPSGRRISPSGRRISPSGRRISPSGRRISPSWRRISPSGRRISPSGRRMSPAGRRISPFARQISPGRRVVSPDRRFSPSGREFHPQRDVTNDNRSRQHVDGRRSPQLRQNSPHRQMRYSPSQDHDDVPIDKYENNARSLKHVRPAYEHKASIQDKFSSGSQPNFHEDKPYHRNSPGREPRWQEKEKQYPPRPNIDKRGPPVPQTLESSRFSEQQRLIEQQNKPRSLTRESPRERSPIRDRVKRHSPSPRSPRRSWALEKRHSPNMDEAPPPPIWPGQEDTQMQRPDRPRRPPYSEKVEDEDVHFERKLEELRRSRSNMEDNRGRGAGNWKPIPQAIDRVSPPRFAERDRFAGHTDKLERKDLNKYEDIFQRESNQESGKLKEFPRSSREEKSRRDYEPMDDIAYTKEQKPRHSEQYKEIEILSKPGQLYEEIDDVYRRAVEFTKKMENFRKGDHKKDSYMDRRRDIPEREEFEQRHTQSLREEMDKRSRDDFANEIQRRMRENEKGKKEIKKEDDFHNIKYKLSAQTKEKRNKAVSEISEKIMSKCGRNFTGDLHTNIHEELKKEIGRILFDMFGNEDVSFVECVIKFNARHKDEIDIFKKVATNVLNDRKGLKRHNKDDDDNIPVNSPKAARVSKFSKEQLPVANDPQQWSMGMVPSTSAVVYPGACVPPVGVVMNSCHYNPTMVPMPTEYQYVQPYPQITQPVEETNDTDGLRLYLCKDDLSPFVEPEEEMLKKFIVDQLFKVSQMSQGWSPDFTLSKQNNALRREIITRDERSRDWLLNLDFSEFKSFNVLIHTPEQLWYLRAAIWLPGHSKRTLTIKGKNFDPLTKLKLQNKTLEGVDIDKWKFVKKIVTVKGSRIYVDMPPASVSALKKYNMMLSYELQKVSVFMRADAIDINVFDAGLKEISVVPTTHEDTPMPSIGNESKVVKFARNNKQMTMSLQFARIVKERIIYRMYRYLSEGGSSKTDFVKYGFCKPGYLGVVPENEESRRFLCSLDLQKINNCEIIVLESDNKNTRYIKMSVTFPTNMHVISSDVVFECLRKNNQSIKGINFQMWKNAKVVHRGKVEFDMDIESVEAIIRNRYKLNCSNDDDSTASVRSEYTTGRLEDVIKKLKRELSDTYDIANMDISSESEDDVILCE